MSDTDQVCAYCGGSVELRNPTGSCDHLYWPDMLSDEAKIANGYSKHIIEQEVWLKL